MWLKKDSGGTTVKWGGAEYHWAADGDVRDVPVELAMELLAIRGGGYSEGQAPEPAEDDGDDGEGEATPKPAQRRKAAAKAGEGEGS